MNFSFNEQKRFIKFLKKIKYGEKPSIDDLLLLNKLDSRINEKNYKQFAFSDEAIKNMASKVFNVCIDEVTTSTKDYSSNPSKYKVLLCDLDTAYNNENLPYVVEGDLNIFSPYVFEKEKLPKIVGGSINLTKATEYDLSLLPEYIGRDININKVNEINNLTLQDDFEGNVYLDSLEKANNIDMSKSKVKEVNLRNLKYINTLKYPNTYLYDISLEKLAYFNRLELPQRLVGNLNLESNKKFNNVKFPQDVYGYIDISNYEGQDKIVLPSKTNNLFLCEVEDASNIVFPDEVDGYIYMFKLKTPYGLKLPYDFDINNLVCPKNVKDKILEEPSLYRKNKEKELVLRK